MKKNIIIIFLLICTMSFSFLIVRKVNQYNYIQSGIDNQFENELVSLVSSLNVNYGNMTSEQADYYYTESIYSLKCLMDLHGFTTYFNENQRLNQTINYLYSYVYQYSLLESELSNPYNDELRNSLIEFSKNLESEEKAQNLIDMIKKHDNRP